MSSRCAGLAARLTSWRWIAIATFFGVAALQAIAEEPPAKVLWWDAEKTRIRFVPGSLLEPLGDWAHPETLNASRLDLSAESWNRIKTTVSEAVLQAREAGTSIQSMLADRCTKSAPHAGISFRQRKPLARHIIETWDVAFVARVEELEGGWDPGVYAASTLVTVRPTMWLKRSQELDADLAVLRFVVRGAGLSWATTSCARRCHLGSGCRSPVRAS